MKYYACEFACITSNQTLFSKNCLKYRIAQIVLINGFNPVFKLLSPNFVFVGTPLGSRGSCWTLKMYSKVHIVLYFCGTVINLGCFVIAIVLTYIYAQPCENTETFIRVWSTNIVKSEYRKVLRSLKPCGFCIVPYGIVREKLGLLICDDIVRNTVTATLLDSV